MEDISAAGIVIISLTNTGKNMIKGLMHSGKIHISLNLGLKPAPPRR
jgi:hypothetical protein